MELQEYMDSAQHRFYERSREDMYGKFRKQKKAQLAAEAKTNKQEFIRRLVMNLGQM